MKWALFIYSDPPHEWCLWGLYDDSAAALAEQTRQRTHRPILRCRIKHINFLASDFDARTICKDNLQ